MIELLVLIAIAYAGARGVESMTGHGDRRHDTEAAREAVTKVAETSATPATTAKTPGPTDPGGTFSAAAPRSASLGAKVAAPLAIAAETSTAMWKAVGEGYRERWPEIRAERRKQMAARAAKRKTEKAAAEAEEAARAAAEKAGPPPAYPPKPTTPPTVAPPTATPPAAPAPPGPGINGPQPVMSWPGDGSARIPAQPTPDPGRHLTAVPDPAQNGDPMSSPSTIVPEIRTLDGLLNALTLFRAMCEMRAEEAMAIAVDDLALSNRLDQMETELADLDVDDKTRAEIDGLRDTIHAQSQAAAQYGSAAKDAADLALATAQAAHKNHGGIAEAVQSSPIEVAAQAGYYNR
ncbi:hypothetical protein OS965_02380 [Streptomyces sp. H27-G5]|uniref:hypothetical protein n=1 Tax=Streptomyces sp. H27-G5 TaxID=2996698 RepID=UPI00226EACD5|nr:hypothetical protein [Streptomyces sp. H27-G5]MCY0917023.1 hypothetical protein [Streptomyces sp. H27-G5]